MSYEYAATVVRVIDGDTVVFDLKKDFSFDIDFGFYVTDTIWLTKSAQINFRLLGINTPEMRKPTIVEGKAAKAELEKLLSLGKIRVITSRTDKYGRWLADVFVTGPDGAEFSVSQKMIEGGFAVPYMT
jgi:endonuclease YncB( thermonuclease family)